MAGPPLLTVALPTYNGARHLAEALRSIQAQQGVSFELLVCDDRSADETRAIVRREAGDRVRVEVNSERLGLAGNWNRCVALSRTPWVAIFHQDDVMRPGHLAAHAAVVATADPTLGMICGASEVIDDQGRPVPPSVVARGDLGPGDRGFPPGAFLPELAVTNPVRCSTVTLRAEAHAAIGGFDPRFRYAVDWEFWIHLARTWSVVWRHEPSVAIRWHPASETHRFTTGTDDIDEVIRVLDDLYRHDGPRLPEARRLRRVANRRLARAFLNRSHVALRAGAAPLARRCLNRAVSLWPGILGTIAQDPRLAAQMVALLIAPGAAGRWLGEHHRRAT